MWKPVIFFDVEKPFETNNLAKNRGTKSRNESFLVHPSQIWYPTVPFGLAKNSLKFQVLEMTACQRLLWKLRPKGSRITACVHGPR